MSAELHWLPADASQTRDTRPRCRYCRRVLTFAPLTPAEFPPHCTAGGCRVCAECSEGETSVSPVKK